MSLRVVVIDYQSGNLHSAAKAFERAARALDANAEVTISSDPAALTDATHIVLPGVGAFADCMRGLQAVPGMIAALEAQVLSGKKPFFGVCVGMQLLAKKGYEHGVHDGLGWLDGEVRQITPADASLKIPHMGWNELVAKNHPLFSGLKDKSDAYFVHSYHMILTNPAGVIATTDYGGAITAAVACGNIIGTQFHPEKSQQVGQVIIQNFLRM